MTRLGLVGGAAMWHARSFAGILNRKNDAAWREAGFPPYESRPIDGASVVAICDENISAARELAGKVEGIERVTDDPRSLLGFVDAVLICDDVTERHQKRAAPFLEAGLPTFIDKPLSRDPAEAEAILALAERHGTPVLSCSALRFATEIAALDREALGDLKCVVAAGPGELVFYGIHPCELAHSLMGPGAKSVRHAGDEHRNQVIVDYGDGRSMVLVVRDDIAYTFRAVLLGARGSAAVAVDDSAGFYRGMLEAFVQMARDRVMPVPPAHTLEIMRILAAAARSRDTGEAIRL